MGTLQTKSTFKGVYDKAAHLVIILQAFLAVIHAHNHSHKICIFHFVIIIDHNPLVFILLFPAIHSAFREHVIPLH